MQQVDDVPVPIEKHTVFYEVAYTSFLEAERLLKERKRYQRALVRGAKEETDDDRDFVATSIASEERAAVVTVIFSALALEAFINDYGLSRFAKGFFDKHLDRLDPTSKWVIFPRLAKGKGIATDGESFGLLSRLFHLRNRLAHFKSSKRRPSEMKRDDRIMMEHAKEALEAVERIVAELRRVDGTIDFRWLSEARKIPLD